MTVDIAGRRSAGQRRQPERAADQFSIVADPIPVPALPVAGAIPLAVLLLFGAVRRRAYSFGSR